MSPFRRFIPVATLAGCDALATAVLQPPAAVASIKSEMGGPVEQLVRERRYDRALERLMEAYQGRVYRMALVMLRDPARAEDVTQDVFVKLWRALPLYDGRATLATWLYTIARNTCLSARRAEAYRPTTALGDTTEPMANAIEPLSLTLEQCVSRLPDVQREVITLFYMEIAASRTLRRCSTCPWAPSRVTCIAPGERWAR